MQGIFSFKMYNVSVIFFLYDPGCTHVILHVCLNARVDSYSHMHAPLFEQDFVFWTSRCTFKLLLVIRSEPAKKDTKS